MKKHIIIALAVLTMSASVAALAQQTNQEKVICELAAQNCLNKSEILQKRIKKLNTEIKKGTRSYSAEDLKKLEQKKPVVFCGDLNVAHTEIDLANPKANVHNHGFTIEERAGFTAFVNAGFLDTFREFEQGGGHYTWWSVFGGARARNVGWRLDYFLVSQSLRPRLQNAFIRAGVTGSDHCPVGIEIK